MNTTGYKRQRAEFQDLLYQDQRRVGSASSDAGTLVPAGVQAVKVSTMGANHDVNLYSRYAIPMRNWETDPDLRADGDAADEVLRVATPKPGRYFLDVGRGISRRCVDRRGR